MILDDNELRILMRDLFNAPTARDKQVRLGASDISDACSRCLGLKFLGDERSTPFADRPWLGRVIGNALHAYAEQRVGEGVVPALVEMGAVSEGQVEIAEIPGYGWFGGHVDLRLPHQILDIKGTERKKLLPLIDALCVALGKPPIYGRQHTAVKLSERDYQAAINSNIFKLQSYIGQQNLYMHGLRRAGHDIRQASLYMICRDGTGFFDNPDLDGWSDEAKVHDTHLFTFQYDENLVNGLIERAAAIFEHVTSTGSAEGLQPADECFVCKTEERELIKLNSLPDIITTIDL